MAGERLLITGSRDWTDVDAIRRVLQQLPPGSVVIHGAQRGADTIADVQAKALGLTPLPYPARWDVHDPEFCRCPSPRPRTCNGAGRERNQRMLDEGRPTRAVAFPLPSSRGTRDMVRRLKAAGVPVEIVQPPQRREGR